jgi:hypothetical protein
VLKNQDGSPKTFVTGLFWDAFSAASAVTTLLHIGFADDEVDAVGVLGGRPPDLSEFLFGMGIPVVDAIYYNNCFQDGAVLLIVRTHPDHRRRIALEVIRGHGGILHPTCERFKATPVAVTRSSTILEKSRKAGLL